MKIFFVFSIIFLSACQTSGPKDIDVPFDDWGTAKPGTVVSQSSEALKNGFYDVTKSSVNQQVTGKASGTLAISILVKLKFVSVAALTLSPHRTEDISSITLIKTNA